MPDLERWVAANGGEVEWFKDTFTGKSMDRPGLQKLLDAMRAGKVERIVVWRLDRLGRTAKGLTALFEELRERVRRAGEPEGRPRLFRACWTVDGERAGLGRGLRNRNSR